MSEVDWNEPDPHMLADIPNLAAYNTAQLVGRDAMGQIWYDGIRSLRGHVTFGKARDATVAAAEVLYGK